MDLYRITIKERMPKFTLVMLALVVITLLFILHQPAYASTSWAGGIYVGPAQEGKAINIRDRQGNHRVYSLAPYVSISINGGSARLGDLYNGLEVSVTLKDGKAAIIRGMDAQSADIHPVAQLMEAKAIHGEIRNVNLSGEELTIFSEDEWQVYSFDQNTVIVKERISVPPERIYVGDTVRAHVEGGGYLSRVEIYGNSNNIRDVFKGKIAGINPVRSQLILKDVASYFYGSWYPEAPIMLLDIDPKAPIYAGHTFLGWEGLERAPLGQEIYVAAANGYAGLKGVKLLYKEGPARFNNNYIHELDLAAGYIALKEGAGGGSYGPGTIILRNGKLVEGEGLDEDSHVFLETNTKNDF
ncbi:MAG: hypothetical protein GX318_07470, partial [Clostridia bacterium]|nr:hypothetical protein [Clostridia bacterium]